MGCGESKHVATENTISRKNSRAGSRRGNRAPETTEARSELDRNTSSLMNEKGKSVNQDPGADNSRGMADGNGIVESTGYEEMGCGESKHVATGNTISRKNSRAGSKRGKTPETIEATSRLDRNRSSLMKGDGKSVNQDSASANNSRAVVADGNGLAKSTEYAEIGCDGESKHVGKTISRKNSRAGSKRGKTPETIEETSKLDRSTSSLMKKEGKSDNDQDSAGADNSRVVADGNGIAESTEYTEMGCGESKHVATDNTVSRKNSRAGSKRVKTPETIEETSKLDKNTSLSMKEEGKSVDDQDSADADISRTVANGNGVAEGTEYAETRYDESKQVVTENTISQNNSRAELQEANKTPETIEETRKLDRNTSSVEEGKSVNYQDPGANNPKVVADGNDIAESTELKKQENVENDNKEKQNGVSKEKEEPIEGIALKAIPGSSGKQSLSNENLKVADDLEDTKLAEEISKEETKEDAKDETVKDQKLAEEKKEEIADGEPETVKGENSVKETATAETTEDKVSTPAAKEEERPAGSPAKDSKTE